MCVKTVICCVGSLCLLLLIPSISAGNHIVIKDQYLFTFIETNHGQEKKNEKQMTGTIQRSVVWFLWYIAYMTARFGVFEIISEFFSFFAYRLAERWGCSELLPPA
ncbi:MAG: hypothetical protein NT038_08970 [Euryarchaeota archaeon]|nr:hypothetical protein [Euryarchaeota archaeon]